MTEVMPIEERTRGQRCCNDDALTHISGEEAQQLASDLLVFAHPIRLQLLHMLARNAGQVCVCDLEAAVPVKQPTVSHHLKLLREAGLIDCERHGLWAYYFVRRDEFARRWARVRSHFDALM
jgi:ArsR family transcriptional regulator, arsenate/arsenite/antimonite-responsive transcriptional repressor